MVLNNNSAARSLPPRRATTPALGTFPATDLALLNMEKRMKNELCTALAGVLLVTSVPALAQTTGGQGTNQSNPMQQAPAGTPAGVNAAPLSDGDFVAAAAVANRFEIQGAELALAQAGDARLKDFARMMLTDHKMALQELEAAAKEAGVAMPTEPALDQSHATKISALESRKDPAEFDRAYRADQMQAHQQAVTLLETYQRTGAKNSLRVWAAKTLPVVKKHLEKLNSMK